MKLQAALVISLGLALTACSSSRSVPTVELPGGVTPEEANPTVRPPNFFERMLGQDDRPNVGPCPLMGVLYDNSRQVSFASADNQRYANIAFTGEVQGVRGLCRYVEDDPITMALEVDMAFGRGTASTSDRQTYRYWVAVTRRGRAPIEKAYFDVDVRWRRGEGRTMLIGALAADGGAWVRDGSRPICRILVEQWLDMPEVTRRDGDVDYAACVLVHDPDRGAQGARDTVVEHLYEVRPDRSLLVIN